MAENSRHTGYGVAFSDGTQVRVGMLRQSAQTDMFGGVATNFSSDKDIATLEVQHKFRGVTTVTTVGQMQETGSLMGLTGNGALGFSANGSTTFASFAANKPLTSTLSLSAMAAMGVTSGVENMAAGSVVDGTTSSMSAAWSVGLANTDVFRTGDKMGFTMAMPLRTMSGAMAVTTAVSQDSQTGAMQYASQSLGLAPSGTEKDLELSYSRSLQGGATWTALAQAKLQPGHDANAASQYGIGLRYAKSF